MSGGIYERFWNRLHVQVAILILHCSLRRLRRIVEHRRNNGGQQLEHQTGVKLPTYEVVVEELPQATANIANMMVSTTNIHNMSTVDYLSLYIISLAIG